jgi:hypothetical protein
MVAIPRAHDETHSATGRPASSVSGGDDAFDAVVGLCGMLDIVQGTRYSDEPAGPPSITVAAGF